MRSSGGGASKPRRRGTGSQKSCRNGSKSTSPRPSQILTVSSSSSDSQQPSQVKEEPEIQESEEEEAVAETKRSSESGKQKQKLQAQAQGRRERNGNDDEEEEDGDEDEDDAEGNDKKEAQKSLYTFPMRRVDRIIRSEGSDFHISQEAIFLINKATETFIESLSKDAYSFSAKSRKNTVRYKNLSTVVRKQRKYDFLSDFVPEQIKAEDALAEAKK